MRAAANGFGTRQIAKTTFSISSVFVLLSLDSQARLFTGERERETFKYVEEPEEAMTRYSRRPVSISMTRNPVSPGSPSVAEVRLDPVD